jgi:CDP-diacylglycerol--serine O-phosphatidyltransferase
MNNRFEAAAVAVFIAMLLDGIDGRVARLTNTQTDFGAEYDSLADMVSFGMAPALVMYQWALSDLGKLGWLAAFIYAVAAALRLARFNTKASSTDKRYFQGLPSPAAAAVVVGFVWACFDNGIDGSAVAMISLPIIVFAGLMMVSNVAYYSFKDIDFHNKVPFMAMLVVVMVFVFASIDPPITLFGCCMVYAISGPAISLVRRFKKRTKTE